MDAVCESPARKALETATGVPTVVGLRAHTEPASASIAP
jgi:hypothetical protein